MDVELFDENREPVVKLVLEIYDYSDDDFIPNWWLEVSESANPKEIHFRGILMSLPSMERQIEKLVELFNEAE